MSVHLHHKSSRVRKNKETVKQVDCNYWKRENIVSKTVLFTGRLHLFKYFFLPQAAYQQCSRDKDILIRWKSFE